MTQPHRFFFPLRERRGEKKKSTESSVYSSSRWQLWVRKSVTSLSLHTTSCLQPLSLQELLPLADSTRREELQGKREEIVRRCTLLLVGVWLMCDWNHQCAKAGITHVCHEERNLKKKNILENMSHGVIIAGVGGGKHSSLTLHNFKGTQLCELV